MPSGGPTVALGAFARVLKDVARTYHVPHGGLATRKVTRASALSVYKTLLRRAHPDKGGDASDFRKLVEAKETWDATCSTDQVPKARAAPATLRKPAAARPAGFSRPGGATSAPRASSTAVVESTPCVCRFCEEDNATGFRVRGLGVLLTYNNKDFEGVDAWEDFKVWIGDHMLAWDALYYCATQELCRGARAHFHLMLQFRSKADCLSSTFAYRGVKPNARPTWQDYCGQGLAKRNPHAALNRGFFYVWANKLGTCIDANGLPCVFGNYAPVWTKERYVYIPSPGYSVFWWLKPCEFEFPYISSRIGRAHFLVHSVFLFI